MRLRLVISCQLAVLAGIVGVLGPWRNVGAVSLDGLQGPHDGWLVIVALLLALAGVGSLARTGLTLVAAAAALYFVVDNLLDDRAAVGGSSGWGIWLTLLAALALGVLAVLAAVRGSN